MLTTDQIKARTKTVTRRLGWGFLKPGDQIRAVEKCQGLKKGEKMRPLAVLEVVDVQREPLCDITQADVVSEGFPDSDCSGFIAMFCASHRLSRPCAWPDYDRTETRACLPTDDVTRIEFKYVSPQEQD